MDKRIEKLKKRFSQVTTGISLGEYVSAISVYTAI